jgi:hypothetical protein
MVLRVELARVQLLVAREHFSNFNLSIKNVVTYTFCNKKLS